MPRDRACGRVFTHTGSNNKWYCITSFAPEKDFAMLVTRGQGGDVAMKAVNEALNAPIRDHVEHASPSPK